MTHLWGTRLFHGVRRQASIAGGYASRPVGHFDEFFSSRDLAEGIKLTGAPALACETDQGWCMPSQRRKTEISDSILRWLKQYPEGWSRDKGNLAKKAVWCDLGEVILFVVDKHAIEELARSQSRLFEYEEFVKVLSPSVKEANKNCVSEEEKLDEGLESRLFANMWWEDAETISVTVEHEGSWEPPFISNSEE
jgi:hypothetical protein